MPRMAIAFIDRPLTSDQHILNSFRHEIEIPDDIFPNIWMDKKVSIEGSNNPGELDSQSSEETDSPVCNEPGMNGSCQFEDNAISDEHEEVFLNNEKCGLYLAESSIPNAGLGVFAGVDIDE
eukprot:5435504-Ditylum_brightwellii.AAC.1